MPAIINAWYPGAEGGKAVASLLFGEFSPSGRLPVTFYRTTEELPDFGDYSMKNRTYRYMKSEALYPFGYGLSYTYFEYSAIKLSKDLIEAGESLECYVTVKNTGSVAGGEVVQLNLKDVEASVDIPVWSLRGVRIVFLHPGEMTKICFELTSRQMAMIDNDGKCVLEPGFFEVYIGGTQPDKRSIALTGTPVLKSRFEVVGKILQLEY